MGENMTFIKFISVKIHVRPDVSATFQYWKAQFDILLMTFVWSSCVKDEAHAC